MTKSILITGATSGIGRALATEFAKRGYALALTGRRTALLEEAQEELGNGAGRVVTRTLDVNDPAAVRTALFELAETMGGIGIIVANAGIAGRGKVGTGNFEHQRRIIETNVIGAMATIDAAVELYRSRREKGHVVGISSVAAFRGFPGNAPYCASKAALSTYLEAVRGEVRQEGITVATISPGYIDTPLNRKLKSRPFVVSVEEGSRQIADLIEKRVENAAAPRWPWELIGVAIRNAPDFLWTRVAT